MLWILDRRQNLLIVHKTISWKTQEVICHKNFKTITFCETNKRPLPCKFNALECEIFLFCWKNEYYFWGFIGIASFVHHKTSSSTTLSGECKFNLMGTENHQKNEGIYIKDQKVSTHVWFIVFPLQWHKRVTRARDLWDFCMNWKEQSLYKIDELGGRGYLE